MTGSKGRVAVPVGADGVPPWQFDEYVLAEADGIAKPEQLAVLAADPAAWRLSLQTMLRETEEHLSSARSLPGDERDQVVADLELEVARLEAAAIGLNPERAPEQRNGGGQVRDRDTRDRPPREQGARDANGPASDSREPLPPG